MMVISSELNVLVSSRPTPTEGAQRAEPLPETCAAQQGLLNNKRGQLYGVVIFIVVLVEYTSFMLHNG